MNGDRSRLPASVLAGLALLLPFEPRRPAWRLAGLQFTLLEIAAALAMLLLAGSLWRRLPQLLRRPPLPVVAFACFALAHLVSATLAPDHRPAALAFSLRMAAAASFATLVAACDAKAIQAALRGAALAACLVASLALLEGLGVRALDPFLDRFRMSPFVFAGSRRASGASENPNLAAALMQYGLVAGVGILSLARHAAGYSASLALFLSLGLVFTYSRGAIVSALTGLAVLAASLRRLGAARGPASALAVVGSVAALALASPVVRERFAVEREAAGYGALYEPLMDSLALAPAEVRRLAIRVTNTGSGSWRPQDGFRMTCGWYAADRWSDAGCDAALAAPLAPGQSVTLHEQVRAPETEGRYYLMWEMFGPHGRFGSLGVPAAAVAATIGAAVPGAHRAAPPTLVFRRGRRELWAVAWAMWRERPLLGFGPDNFRRLHASFAGSFLDDSPHSAHNTLLEVAATTGVLGLVTLLTTLAACLSAARRVQLRAAARQRRVAAAILLGLLAGVITHSTVEHVLGFTAHYLFFGFLVGATAAVERSDLT